MLCYEFAFIIQIVRPLFRWFLAISFDSDIHRDGSGKMLRAKLDCCTFLQEFGTNSDGWAILDCWTGYWPARSWHRAASTLSSSCSIMATAARTPQPNVFTPPNQHLDILQMFLLLYSSAFVVPTSVSIFGMILTIKSSFWQTVGDIKGFSVLTHRSFFAVRRRTLK